ncbi:MAG: Cof-type HAD-IIB family hydrolase [Paramuribaculum sp.]|nr:Cof-type HAD-IIB family hydrolase [Paramuribaculum sp.]
MHYGTNDDIRKTLFVSDLDGTLLSDNARVSSITARIISELSHEGALISVATARTPATVDPLLAHTFTTIPAIVITGAAMWNRRYRHYENVRTIAPEAATTAITACRNAGLKPFIYTLGVENVLHVYHNGGLSNKEEKFVYDRRGLPLKKFHLDEPAGEKDSFESTLLVLVMGDVDTIFNLAETLGMDNRLSISAYQDSYNRTTGIIEILGENVSKASAVTHLKEMTGAERLTVFGDNLNDLPMMAIADTSVATANAVEQVKEAADIVIGSNNDDSVARYILESLSKTGF